MSSQCPDTLREKRAPPEDFFPDEIIEFLNAHEFQFDERFIW
jgi:hypothetical protein